MPRHAGLNLALYEDIKRHAQHEVQQNKVAGWRGKGRVPVTRARTLDHAPDPVRNRADIAHVEWLAEALYAEMRQHGLKHVPMQTRLQLIHELTRGLT